MMGAGAVFAAALMMHTGLPPAPPPVVVSVNDQAQDGIEPTAYRGKFYLSELEPMRQCIIWWETRGHYYSTGQMGAHEGAYQMTDALYRGAAWMMTDEMRATWPRNWSKARNELLTTEGHLWGRFWQDMAFYTIMNWRAPRSGRHHWHLDGSQCNGL